MAFVFPFRVQNNIDFGPPRRGQIRRIKEEFDNGKHYYALHGQPITAPLQIDQAPDAAALRWHNEDCYRG